MAVSPWYSAPMKRKLVLASPTSLSDRTPVPEGEVVTVLGPSEARLPKRRARPGLTTVERFVAVLSSLVDGDTAVAKVNFTKALEARSSAAARPSLAKCSCGEHAGRHGGRARAWRRRGVLARPRNFLRESRPNHSE